MYTLTANEVNAISGGEGDESIPSGPDCYIPGPLDPLPGFPWLGVPPDRIKPVPAPAIIDRIDPYFKPAGGLVANP